VATSKVNDVICIRTFANRPEAEAAKRLLEAHGIRAMVLVDDAGGLRPEIAFIKGASLFVDARQADRALEILPYPPSAENPAERSALDAQFRGCMLPGFIGLALVAAGALTLEAAPWLAVTLFVVAGGLLVTALVRGARAAKDRPRPRLMP
jgi:putative signal transducing protein